MSPIPHPDHLWGLLDDFDDTLMFPNASYLISAAELNFWLGQDAISRLPEDRQNFAVGARRNLERIKEKLQTIETGQDIAAGMRVLDTSGRTAGHICVELSSGRDGVVVLGDGLTHPIISFAHPAWMPATDHHDPQRAAAVRKTLLDKLATNRQRVIGFHLPQIPCRKRCARERNSLSVNGGVDEHAGLIQHRPALGGR
jgi:glyoxylase-like metal-dependent hydrolase (beta-lactamase superfamily II)